MELITTLDELSSREERDNCLAPSTYDSTSTAGASRYSRLQDEIIVTQEEKLSSFGTITIEELNASLLNGAMDTACPTMIWDAVVAGRFDVLEWCRKNGDVDQWYYNIKNIKLPPRSQCEIDYGTSFPYSTREIIYGMTKCEDVNLLDKLVKFLCANNGDGKHFDPHSKSYKSSLVDVLYYASASPNPFFFQWYIDRGYHSLGLVNSADFGTDGENYQHGNDLFNRQYKESKLVTIKGVQCIWSYIKIFTTIPTELLPCNDDFAPLLWFIFDMHHPISSWTSLQNSKSKLNDKTNGNSILYLNFKTQLTQIMDVSIRSICPLPIDIIRIIDFYIPICKILYEERGKSKE